MPIQNSVSGASLLVELSWREDSRFSSSTVKIEEPHKGGPFGCLVSGVNAGLMSRKCRKDFHTRKKFVSYYMCRHSKEEHETVTLKSPSKAQDNYAGSPNCWLPYNC